MNCNDCSNLLKSKYNIDCKASCNIPETKKKIKKLYLKYHPDKGGDPRIFDELKTCADITVF
jgi:hypothetical protein